MKIRTLFILLMLIAIGCKKDTNDNLVYNLHEPDMLTADYYDIYNLITSPDTLEGQIIFIYQKTQNVYLDTARLKEVDEIDDLLIQDYYRKENGEIYLNEDSFLSDNNVKLIPENSSDRDIFNQIYNLPRGIALSNIGYDEDISEAIVGSFEIKDDGCIYYNNYYLKKDNSRWTKLWSEEFVQCPIK
jgi:hypothetical protein